MGKTRRPSVSLTEMMSSADAGAVYAGNDRASQSSEAESSLVGEKKKKQLSPDDNPYENWSTGKHIAVGFAFMCLLWGICFAGTNIMIEALLRMSS